MSKLWKKICLGLVALTMASQAHALILLEPYFGYDFGLDYKSGTSNYDAAGFGYGGRLGIQLLTIMFGVSYDKLDLEIEPQNGGTKSDEDQNNLGLFLGWSPKGEGIRFWGEYFIDVENDKGNNGNQSGDGFGAGLGYKFKPWLALNLEYRDWSLDEPVGTNVSGSSLFLTVSFPFDIL